MVEVHIQLKFTAYTFYTGNTTIVAPTTSSAVAMTTSSVDAMATISITITPVTTNIATPTPGRGDMDGSSCTIYQSMLLVLSLAVLSVAVF